MKHIVLLAAFVAMAAAHHGHVPELRAIARVGDPNNPASIQGNVTFTQLHDGKVRIEGTILGLPHGQYGFHVHEKGDLTGGCLSTGAHFNPEHKQHGHPNDEERHVGDLGNVEFDDTRIGRIDFTDSLISLVGEHGILGRAVVLHERADDFGRSDHPDSRKTGNAGGRVACGVIGILDPVDGWSNTASLAAIAPSMFLLSSLLVLLR
ncbi:superoxide dismutase [Cu-Zn]-like [Cydia fagiglandana]|uniref:superoxide dismutase [Cu-Zn]-like n=1 Tax=Cydia fagiglandana TaxID=1458189 RepID=UPI002FEE037C